MPTQVRLTVCRLLTGLPIALLALQPAPAAADHLPTHGLPPAGVVLFDLNPPGQVDRIPFVVPPNPVVGFNGVAFGTGERVDFLDTTTSTGLWHWETVLSNTSTSAVTFTISFSWPTGGYPAFGGTLTLAAGATGTFDVHVQDNRPPDMGTYRWLANTRTPFPAGVTIDSSITEFLPPVPPEPPPNTFVFTSSASLFASLGPSSSGPGATFVLSPTPEFPADLDFCIIFPDDPNFCCDTCQPIVPEPGALTLLGIGALGLAACAWRRRKKAV